MPGECDLKACFDPGRHVPSVDKEALCKRAIWPSYSPQSQCGLFATMALPRDCHEAKCLPDAPNSWKCRLLPRGKCFRKIGSTT
eukprot:3682008-Lingulodinium_polyedra.AAC.1